MFNDIKFEKKLLSDITKRLDAMEKHKSKSEKLPKNLDEAIEKLKEGGILCDS